MDNIYFKNAYGNRVGWIIGEDIRDSSGNRVGFINGNDIKDSGGNRIGFLNGSDFKDVYGNRVGYINGSDIKDVNGNRAGYPEAGASDIEMCAAALLLLKLEYDSGGSSASSYSDSTYRTSSASEEKSGWWLLALLLFAFWHFLKGPFVAFSLIKETSARKEWWGTCIRSFLLGLLFTMILGATLGRIEDAGPTIVIIFCLTFMMLPIIAVSIRRMHDIGWRGWWILVPLMNFVMCGFFPGKVEGNKYAD